VIVRPFVPRQTDRLLASISLLPDCILLAPTEPTEEYCNALLDKDSEVPDACFTYASVKAKLEAKQSDPFAGMTPGAQAAVKQAQIKRRMSTRHGQGAQGKKSSWF
jgi:hypothetical protein